eukprot:1111934-Pyramimonas_sp.AAC.1
MVAQAVGATVPLEVHIQGYLCYCATALLSYGYCATVLLCYCAMATLLYSALADMVAQAVGAAGAAGGAHSGLPGEVLLPAHGHHEQAHLRRHHLTLPKKTRA